MAICKHNFVVYHILGDRGYSVKVCGDMYA